MYTPGMDVDTVGDVSVKVVDRDIRYVHVDGEGERARELEEGEDKGVPDELE